jgi:uncharacterized protein
MHWRELDSSFEMILSTEDEFSTIEFITDEVLIVIPMTPMHDYGCIAILGKSFT